MVDHHDAADVYRALAPAVLGYLRSQRVPDPEDVLSEVFHGVARDLQRFRGDEIALRRWVFTLAHHRLVDDQRKRARRPEELRAVLPERPAIHDARAVDADLMEALDQLTPDQRHVVTLRFVADLPLRDVARITVVVSARSRHSRLVRSPTCGGSSRSAPAPAPPENAVRPISARGAYDEVREPATRRAVRDEPSAGGVRIAEKTLPSSEGE
jgi:RNA polymerase sigma-70 factor (ECF subfamily)